MLLFGLLERRLQEIVEWYGSRDEADEALRRVLEDEPEWVDLHAQRLGVQAIAARLGRAPSTVSDAIRNPSR